MPLRYRKAFAYENHAGTNRAPRIPGTRHRQGVAPLAAFVSRFGRLQDTVGDKLLPALLSALAEPVGPAIDNLDKAEKLGLLESARHCVAEARRLLSA
jgi:class 3 adenylate cyclase